MGIIISIGRWGGVWVSLSTWAKRICLGWLAITYVPTDGDDVLKAASDWNAGYKELVNARTEIDRLRACIIDMENDTSCLPEDTTVSDAVRLFRKEIKRLTEALVTIAECKDARAMYNVARAAVQDAPRDGE